MSFGVGRVCVNGIVLTQSQSSHGRMLTRPPCMIEFYAVKHLFVRTIRFIIVRIFPMPYNLVMIEFDGKSECNVMENIEA